MINLVSETLVRIIVVLAVAAFFLILVRAVARRLIVAVAVNTLKTKRVVTLTDLLSSSLSAVVLSLAVVMILKEVGFDITPIIASAGILGLALGFGAQTLVKDVLSGFFLLMEDQLDEGDEVEISGKKGLVKKITLRTIWIQDKGGNIHIVPNGSIAMVSNFSKKKV